MNCPDAPHACVQPPATLDYQGLSDAYNSLNQQIYNYLTQGVLEQVGWLNITVTEDLVSCFC